MRKNLSLVITIMLLMFFTSCKNTQENNEAKKEAKSEQSQKKDCKDVHWSHHKGSDGPGNWENLCDSFAACGGQVQSPINISQKDVLVGKELAAPKFSYGKSRVNIINNTHTIQFNLDGGNKVNLNGKEYQLLQFHYHALSEHTLDGKHFPLEVHFVHKHSDTDFAVLGVLFVEGKGNALFDKYLDKFPMTKGEYKSEDLIDLLSLFPKDKSYYHYDGSLTTPPCSEVVNWYVLAEPLEASKEQIEKISKILHDNYRPIMPLNNRKVLSFKM